jgi:thymidylate kinase
MNMKMNANQKNILRSAIKKLYRINKNPPICDDKDSGFYIEALAHLDDNPEKVLADIACKCECMHVVDPSVSSTLLLNPIFFRFHFMNMVEKGLMTSGKYIVFEGIDGVGKSSMIEQVRYFSNYNATAEPFADQNGERPQRIKNIIQNLNNMSFLSKSTSPISLAQKAFCSNRFENLSKAKYKKGNHVSDRSFLSTLAHIPPEKFTEDIQSIAMYDHLISHVLYNVPIFPRAIVYLTPMDHEVHKEKLEARNEKHNIDSEYLLASYDHYINILDKYSPIEIIRFSMDLTKDPHENYQRLKKEIPWLL